MIVGTVLGLLERVAGRLRRDIVPSKSPYAQHVLASRPLACWRLDEMEGSRALDAAGREHEIHYENGIAYFLPGLDLPGLRDGGRISRAVQLAGGRLVAGPVVPAESYTVELWFWNGLPNDARPVTGYLFARSAHGKVAETLGLGGSSGAAGRLFLSRGGPAPRSTGKTEISPKTWHHLVLTRNGVRVAVHLDGDPGPEIDGELAPDVGTELGAMTIGGRDDREATFEGKIDEVALYDRPLAPAEIAEHFRAARDENGQPDR